MWNFSFLAFQGQTTSRKPSPGMRHPPVQISRHLDMKIICFGQVSFPAENLVFQGQSSRSRIPVVAVQVIDLMKTAGPVLCLPCGHQTREGACAGFTCATPSARALNVRGSFHQVPGRQRSSIAVCRQRAGCNPGAAKADGQRAWWQLPRGSHAAVGGL